MRRSWFRYDKFSPMLLNILMLVMIFWPMEQSSSWLLIFLKRDIRATVAIQRTAMQTQVPNENCSENEEKPSFKPGLWMNSV